MSCCPSPGRVAVTSGATVQRDLLHGSPQGSGLRVSRCAKGIISQWSILPFQSLSSPVQPWLLFGFEMARGSQYETPSKQGYRKSVALLLRHGVMISMLPSNLWRPSPDDLSVQLLGSRFQRPLDLGRHQATLPPAIRQLPRQQTLERQPQFSLDPAVKTDFQLWSGGSGCRSSHPFWGSVTPTIGAVRHRRQPARP